MNRALDTYVLDCIKIVRNDTIDAFQGKEHCKYPVGNNIVKNSRGVIKNCRGVSFFWGGAFLSENGVERVPVGLLQGGGVWYECGIRVTSKRPVSIDFSY